MTMALVARTFCSLASPGPGHREHHASQAYHVPLSVTPRLSSLPKGFQGEGTRKPMFEILIFLMKG